jgi:CRISPR-associated endonuclease Csn1
MKNPADPTQNTVWSFDLGTGSLGEAVRNLDGTSFLHRASWLIPEKLAQRGPAAEAGTPASRYRAMKTREAHLAREARLRAICAGAGIEVLSAKRTARGPDKKFHVVQRADPRLTREFPAQGDETCYTSCLLRIKLLRGDTLEGWQVFKALHSAIQRRGYDDQLAWKNRPKRKTDVKDEEGDTARSAQAFLDALAIMAPDHDEFHLPCYLDAWRMDLWSPAQPDVLRLRVNHLAEPARNRAGTASLVAPRDLVVREARLLLDAAAKLFPALTDRADEILFGPGAVPYASYFPELRKKHDLRLGGAGDWDGILGQKVPRFDNRIIAKCALIPRLNACSASPRQLADTTYAPESLLAAEVTFLMKLKHARVLRGSGTPDALTASEVTRLFDSRHASGPANYGFSEKQWATALDALGLRRAPGHDDIAKPNLSGRSRFCRPALRIMRDLLLSGHTPLEQHTVELARLAGNIDVRRGLVPTDLTFLRRMGDTWTDLYIPDQQHDTLIALRENEGPVTAIRSLIGSCNNPIVRHRLEVLWERLRKLENGTADNPAFGVPGEIVLEFVRQDFMGEDAKRELQKFQNDRARSRASARIQTAALPTESRSAALKYELLAAQGGICLYTGQTLAPTDLDELRFEHIVPRAQGGPDAIVNYVVTTTTTNDAKGNRTPYEWFMAERRDQWDAYVARVKQHGTALRAKKVRLLTQPDAAEQVRRYTSLAETAYIAKLAQTLVALHFNWPIRSQEGARRITIVNGGLTARIRRKYQLNSLLNPCPEGHDPREWEEQCEKNRDDDRHHALDAMVISFIPGWARNPAMEGFFRLPTNITRETFAAELEKVMPRQLTYGKTPLAETFYGDRGAGEFREIVQRVPLVELALKPVAPGKTKFDLAYFKKQIRSVRDSNVIAALQSFEGDEVRWRLLCAEFRLPGKSGAKGPRVKKILVTVGLTDEYAEMSKDQSGAWRRGKKGHKGQIVYHDSTGLLAVRPIYAHGSVAAERKMIAALGGRSAFQGFYQSDCTIALTRPLEIGDYKLVVKNEAKQKRRVAPKAPLPAGHYLLNTIVTRSKDVELSTANNTRIATQLATLVAAGLHRV